MKKNPILIISIIFLIGIIGLITLIKLPQEKIQFNYYITGEVITGMQTGPEIDWNDQQQTPVKDVQYVSELNRKYCLKKDIPGILYELEQKKDIINNIKKAYCKSKDQFDFSAFNPCDELIHSRCKGIGKIRGEQFTEKTKEICEEWKQNLADKLDKEQFCETGCCVCKVPLKTGNINELKIRNYHKNCSAICKQIEKQIIEQNFMNMGTTANIRQTTTDIPYRFINIDTEWSTNCKKTSSITLPKKEIIDPPKEKIIIPPLTEPTGPIRTNPLTTPPLYTKTDLDKITKPKIQCPLGAEPITTEGIQCKCKDPTKVLTEKGCLSCEELCQQKGMTTQQQDWSNHILSILNKPENSCKQKVNIKTKRTKIGNCNCYSKTPPEINIDSSLLVCKNTPCGNVACGETKSCEQGRTTITVSCKWGGWQMLRPGVFAPKAGVSAQS